MHFHSTLGQDLGTSSAMLEACTHVAEATSLIDLERRLDYWLTQLYAPSNWTITCTLRGSDKPLFVLQQTLSSQRSLTTTATALIELPLKVAANIVGHFSITIDRQPADAQTPDEFDQLTDVLTTKLHQMCLQLQTLSQTAELLFMRALMHGETTALVDRGLDELAARLLEQLDVGSIQVLIDRLDPGGLSWGIASYRANLALSVGQRQRLLHMVTAMFAAPEAAASGYVLVRRAQIRALAEEHDLSHLAQLQSLLLVAIRNDATLLGVVIVGEERHWGRQPIAPQVVSVCALLAQAVGRSVARNRLVEEVLIRERSMQALIDALDDAVVAVKQGRIISWNRAAHDLFGYEAEEVLGRSLREVLPGLPEELLCPPAQTSAREHTKYTCEWRLQTTGGQGLLLSRTVTDVQTSATEPSSLLYVFKDTGQQQELEYLKDELLSSVSHELRTPLNGIYGFGRLLLDRPHMNEATRREALESLQASIERLTRLTDDLIDLARARRHRLPLEFDHVDISQVVRSAVRELKRRHNAHMITLRVQTQLPLVRGDSMRIKQIIDNLVSNAAKYSADGTRICIAVRRRGNMIAISVKDCGIGIPKAVQQHVFEAFYRADNSRSQRASGVGLGLSIVKSLVEAHDGHVMVRSSVGRGSTFTFTLPLENTTPRTIAPKDVQANWTIASSL